MTKASIESKETELIASFLNVKDDARGLKVLSSRHYHFIIVRTTIYSGSETLLEKRQACESDTSQALTVHRADKAETSYMELL